MDKNISEHNSSSLPEVRISGSADIEKEERKEQEKKNDDDKYIIKFKDPYKFEDMEPVKQVDLRGLEDLKASDMIQVQRIMEKSGSINILPEMSLEYACLFAAKATDYPVEFFQGFPPKQGTRLKNIVTNFLYGED